MYTCCTSTVSTFRVKYLVLVIFCTCWLFVNGGCVGKLNRSCNTNKMSKINMNSITSAIHTFSIRTGAHPRFELQNCLIYGETGCVFVLCHFDLYPTIQMYVYLCIVDAYICLVVAFYSCTVAMLRA